MQYSVPQFIEVEDNIFGPLTLKQFLVLLVGGLLIVAVWRILGIGFLFFIFSLPILGLSLALAFGKFNGRPLFANFLPLVQFYATPRYRVFQRTGDDFPVILEKKGKADLPQEQAETSETHESRLKKLAYLLDQKAAEEDRLIHSKGVEKKWLNQI